MELDALSSYSRRGELAPQGSLLVPKSLSCTHSHPPHISSPHLISISLILFQYSSLFTTSRFMHPSIHPSIRPSIYPSINTSIHLSIHQYVHPSVRPFVWSSVRLFIHTFILTKTQTQTTTHMQTLIHTLTYTYTHSHRHRYIHICIYTGTCFLAFHTYIIYLSLTLASF